LGVAVKSRHELSIAWQHRCRSPRNLQRRQTSIAESARKASVDGGSGNRSLAAAFESCRGTADASTRTTVPNGHVS
jgi:hypothetical protein